MAGSMLDGPTTSAALAADKKLRQQASDDQVFPDEMDTPHDVSARVRFARYRALQSFRSSPWHPKENLPVSYSRIFQFEDFLGMQRRSVYTVYMSCITCMYITPYPNTYMAYYTTLHIHTYTSHIRSPTNIVHICTTQIYRAINERKQIEMLQNTIELKKHQITQKSKKSVSGSNRSRSASLSTGPTGAGAGDGNYAEEMDTDDIAVMAEDDTAEVGEGIEYGMEVVEGTTVVGEGQEKPYLVAGTTDYITSG